MRTGRLEELKELRGVRAGPEKLSATRRGRWDARARGRLDVPGHRGGQTQKAKVPLRPRVPRRARVPQRARVPRRASVPQGASVPQSDDMGGVNHCREDGSTSRKEPSAMHVSVSSVTKACAVLL